MKIPYMAPDGKLYEIDFRHADAPPRYANPGNLIVELPPEVGNTVILPRSWFDDAFLKDIGLPFEGLRR